MSAFIDWTRISETEKLAYQFYQLLGRAQFPGDAIGAERLRETLAARKRFRQLKPGAEMTRYEREMEEKENKKRTATEVAALREASEISLVSDLKRAKEAQDNFRLMDAEVYYDKATRSLKPLAQRTEFAATNMSEALLAQAKQMLNLPSAEEVEKLHERLAETSCICTCGNPNPHVPGGIWCRNK